jgi:hypothetical protein
VLVALQRLLSVLGAESPAAYALALPAISLCTNPRHPDSLNLLEDGLALWLVALRHAPAPDPRLLEPFTELAAGMLSSTEHLAPGMRIATSCVLLGEAFL